MSKTASELKDLASYQIYGTGNSFGDLWKKGQTLQAAVDEIRDFYDAEAEQDPDYDLVAGDDVVEEILLDGAKDLFDENGDNPATEQQLQALLDDERIDAYDLAGYMDYWSTGVWSVEFEAKHRAAEVVAA